MCFRLFRRRRNHGDAITGISPATQPNTVFTQEEIARERIDDVPDVQTHYENLVMEGGGVRGIALASAVVELDKLGIYSQIRRFAGSSAGAIVATALAVGYTPFETADIALGLDFKRFVDDSGGIVRDAARVISNYGYCKGEYFLQWAENLIFAKTGCPRYTFGALKRDRGVDLIITGTNLTKRKLDLFSSDTVPDMAISDAIRISMSLPIIFIPVEHNGCVYVDGGVLCNYPIDVFDALYPSREDAVRSTLGLKLVTPSEARTGDIVDTHVEIKNVAQYATSIIESLGWQIERLQVREGYWDRTVCINTGHVKTEDFELSNDDKRFLYENGKKAVQEFFAGRPLTSELELTSGLGNSGTLQL